MRSVRSVGIVSVLLLCRIVEAQESPKITKLKDLCIDTMLVAGGKPQAVIVAPSGNRYADAIDAIQSAIKKSANVELPVQRGAVNSEELLKGQNVIALGNMATNPFVEQMYRQWYVLLDLKYPGKGGHVVRSLHNPYATGHNVIWIGGSDDGGVAEAAKVFADLLKPGDPLKVGWLMKIKLGEGMVPPKIGDDVPDWVVYGWRDSWRKVGDKKAGSDRPATFFGWNPISLSGVLYYMTGRKEYLDYFKAMAMPDPKKIPIPNRTDDAFNDPMNPLVKNYHYRAHLVDCVFDLIEESPLFTDEERLFITNKLVEHQDDYDPKDDFPKSNISRHGMWHMLNIYTGSRYLAKYYPSPRWNKRMENVRSAFHGWIGNPTWGELDTLCWVSTSTEPVFEFFMLDGFKEFVESGTARTMMSAIEILWTGATVEESNRYLSISLLHKAAYMLKDGRYIWLARQLGFDFDVFRIGQSFWPPDSLKIEPPTDLIGKISYYPLPKTYWAWTGESIPLEEGFQVFSYRSGLTEKDDFFQIDGFYGRGRNPYHVNPIYILRMFGQTLLSGYSSQLQVRRNGMVEPKVAMAAALKRAVALDGAAYVKTQVPNMPFSSWDRHVLYIGGDYAVILDEIQPKESGIFEVSAGWDLTGGPKQNKDAPRCVATSSGTILYCAQPARVSLEGRTACQSWTGDLKKGEPFILSNLIFCTSEDNKHSYRIDPVGERATLIRGDKAALVCVGDFESDALTAKAAIANVSSERIFLVDALNLTCGGQVVAQCDRPISMLWRLAGGDLCVEAKEDCRLILAGAEKKLLELKSGRHILGKVAPAPGVVEAIARSLDTLKGMVKEETPVAQKAEERKADWQPQWQVKLSGEVTQLAVASHSDPENIWAVTEKEKQVEGSKKPERFGRLSVLSPDGKVVKTQGYDTRLLSLLTAEDDTQAKSFAALVGFRDDVFRAFSASGDEIWKEQAAIHPSFKIGDRYNAPWFSDPRPGPYENRGVFSILVGDFWGKGKEEIAIGRPCTVEFRELNGKLIERVATQWGDNTSLAMLRKPGKDGDKDRPRWLLVGKFVTGSPGVSVIGDDHKCVGDSFYGGAEAGTTHMNAWSQRGLSHMVTSDIDNDGIEEVIIVLSGHWNQVNVYKGGEGKCLWTRCFGPARSRSRFMTSLVVADMSGDGNKEVIVGMQNGWVCAFDKTGAPLWQKQFPSAVLSMCASGSPARPIAGCGDGGLVVLDAKGNILHTAILDAGVGALYAEGDLVIAGTESGTVAEFRAPQ